MSDTSRKPSDNGKGKGLNEDMNRLPLVKINFIMMAASAVLIIAGFLLMLGGSFGLL